MARVTVEDCIEKVPNRFDLVMFAAQRAREISAGSALTVDRDNDKNPVVALREIAVENVAPDALEQSLVQGLQKQADFDEFEDEEAIEALEADMRAHLQSGVPLAAVVDSEAPESAADETESSSDEGESEPDETDDTSGVEEDA